MTSMGNLLHPVPLNLSELPPHPSISQSVSQQTDSPSADTSPRLLTFLLAILDEASAFTSPPRFSSTFSSIQTKTSPPSAAPVELLKKQVRASELSSIRWSENQKVPRKRPAKLEDENWCARRSVHENISSKEKQGSASWDEFVFGFKKNHSKHEQDFTPTLYDAHHVIDWNDEIRKLCMNEEVGREWTSDVPGVRYTDVTMEIFEMCHSLPGPLSPRCFPVLVITAYTSPSSFLVVTVPVNLTSSTPLEAAYYSSGRNLTDQDGTEQQRKKPVLGVYVAVETVRLLEPLDKLGPEDRMIEWTMATASDVNGNLPMFVQKSSMPWAVARDVGFFTAWIKTVDINGQPKETAS